MSQSPQLRSLYRRFLRELPTNTAVSVKKSPSILSHPSPLQQRIRASFSSSADGKLEDTQAAEQFILYLRSQRKYATLIERYNKGLGGDMDLEENVRLTAKRVGMVMEDWYDKK